MDGHSKEFFFLEVNARLQVSRGRCALRTRQRHQVDIC